MPELCNRLMQNPWVRIFLPITSPIIGGAAAFLGTFLVCVILELTFFPGVGAVGWLFCFITVPLGMVAAPVYVWRYFKAHPTQNVENPPRKG